MSDQLVERSAACERASPSTDASREALYVDRHPAMRLNDRRRMMRWMAVSAWAIGVGSGPVIAAEVQITPSKDDFPAIVTVVGPLEQGDDRKFANIALQSDDAVVAFASVGGSLQAGIGIGRIARIKNMKTIVSNGSLCASACALAWLGGTQRFMGSRARVGFHAAYIKTADGQSLEVGTGNALVGAYVSQLGLADPAILYITHKPPAEMQWLNASDAQKLGISVTTLDDDGKKESRAEPTPVENPVSRPSWKVRQSVSGGIHNVRSGPGTMHGIVFALPAGEGGISVGQCRRPDPGGGQSDWCQVGWRNRQGWAAINGLEQESSGR